MIVRYVLLKLMICLSFAVTAQDQILGKWLSPKQDGHIEIYKQGNQYFGKLVWSKAPRKDTKNPDEKLRSRELLGAIIFSDFVYKKEEWIDGKIYDPHSGKTYSSKIWLSNNNNTLNVRGFVGISLFGRTEKFTRL